MSKVDHFILELSSDVSVAINKELEKKNKSADDIVGIVNATDNNVYVFYKL